MAWFSRELLQDSALPWIAVRTRARSEKRVVAVLSNWGMECWAATSALQRQWSDRKKIVHWPLFPGYVFARVPADGWYPLLDVQGVQTVVKVGRRAAEIDPETLQNVRDFSLGLARAEAEPEYIPWFEPGDLVVVVDGPFAGVRASVVRSDGRMKVSLGMTLLGQGVSVTMPATNLVHVPT